MQVTWIGYPNSTGLDAVGYRLTDALADPLDTAQTYAEELVRLPGCFLCYTPAADAPPVAPLPPRRTVHARPCCTHLWLLRRLCWAAWKRTGMDKAG